MFVAGTGLASLGKEMEPLARAAKAPLSNLGAACAAALWYARSRLGLVATPKISLASHQAVPKSNLASRLYQGSSKTMRCSQSPATVEYV